jgi:hypothetical protein
VYVTVSKSSIKATPASPMYGFQAQVYRGWQRSTSYDSIGKLKQSIGSFGEALIESGAKCR